MPELPEVETVMRGLRPILEGRRIAGVELRRGGLRFPFPPGFAARLTGRRVEALTRRAKYILASLDGGDCLLIHLGMTGRFSLAGSGGTASHDHVVFRLDDGTSLVYSDPRRFGMMDVFSAGDGHRLLNDIGVEPLGNEFHARYLATKLAGRSAPLKAALLDQRVIAGLGNIYVCEALHRAGLSPRRKARTLARRERIDPRLEGLVRYIREVLIDAIDAGGSTLRDFAHADGGSGAYQQRFLVYDRAGKPCFTCATPIKRIVQSGRSSFYCTRCQR